MDEDMTHSGFWSPEIVDRNGVGTIRGAIPYSFRYWLWLIPRYQGILHKRIRHEIAYFWKKENRGLKINKIAEKRLETAERLENLTPVHACVCTWVPPPPRGFQYYELKLTKRGLNAAPLLSWTESIMGTLHREIEAFLVTHSFTFKDKGALPYIGRHNWVFFYRS